MTQIGNFHKGPRNGFSGTITTLTLTVRAVDIRPMPKTSQSAPDFRIYSGETELGVGWKKLSKSGREYISVKLDDPSFPAPVHASLVEAQGSYALVWRRGLGELAPERRASARRSSPQDYSAA